MDLLFIVDPLESLKAYKDTTVTMMRAAQSRGHVIHVCEQSLLQWRDGVVSASAARLSLTDEDADWYRADGQEMRALKDFGAVLMRKDPPFDLEYVTSTWLLSAAEREGAKVINSPLAVRDHNEKFAIAEFPQFTARTMVARDMALLQSFIEAEQDVILKRLDGMGGAGIFRVRADDPNRNVIVETLSEFGARMVMAQQFIPEIRDGDKRVLLIGGKPVPFCLARIPKPGESRGNLAAGGTGVARPLSAGDLQIATTLGPVLAARGLLLVGLDVIGDRLTEVNVTSPTCFREIMDQTGFDVAGMFIDAVEEKLA